MVLIQILIWLVGITSTLYIAGYLMFFDGAVDLIMSIINMFKDGATIELAKTAVLGLVRVWLASMVGWLIILATSAISIWANELI